MNKAIFLGAIGASAYNATDNYVARLEEVNRINSIPGLTWKAAVNSKFKDLPLGASRSLLGVHDDQLLRIKQKIASGHIEEYLAPAGFTAPDDFDSATNWPKCANVITDIRDQSNCGCCWAFGGASAASDRLCIATDGAAQLPVSAQDVCFGASYDGCGGGYLEDTWQYVQSGAVTGGQQEGTGALGSGFCQKFSMPHCHHHGPQGDDPYPAEGDAGCPSQSSPQHKTKCDDDADAGHSKFAADKISFSGTIQSLSSESAIQSAIMAAGPVETAFTVYSDFENYAGGVYKKTSSSVLGGHAVRIVGWGVDAGTKYWKVANSWNPYWGEKGYFRIERGVDSCSIESQGMASAASSKWTYPAPAAPTPAPAPTAPTQTAPPTPAPAPTVDACHGALIHNCKDDKDDALTCLTCAYESEAVAAKCDETVIDSWCGL